MSGPRKRIGQAFAEKKRTGRTLLNGQSGWMFFQRAWHGWWIVELSPVPQTVPRRISLLDRQVFLRESRVLCQSATLHEAIRPHNFAVGAGHTQAKSIAAKTFGISGCAVTARHFPRQDSPSSDRLRGKVAGKVPEKLPKPATFTPAHARSHQSSGLAQRTYCKRSHSGTVPGVFINQVSHVTRS